MLSDRLVRKRTLVLNNLYSNNQTSEKFYEVPDDSALHSVRTSSYRDTHHRLPSINTKNLTTQE